MCYVPGFCEIRVGVTYVWHRQARRRAWLLSRLLTTVSLAPVHDMYLLAFRMAVHAFSD